MYWDMGYLRVDAIHDLAIILIGPGRVGESRPLSGKRRWRCQQVGGFAACKE